MKLNAFDISLNSPQGVYYAGTAVSGTVVVSLNEEMKMRGVRLRFDGRAKTHWTESRKSGDHYVTDHYYGNEVYFEQEITIWGNPTGSSGENPTMPPGMHTFTFTFPIPPNAPTSFEGSYGFIRYTIMGVIDRPWKFDHETKCAFTVLGLYDLNREPAAPQPVALEDQKTLGALCCVAGVLTCTLRMPKTGYVAGEVLSVWADIANNSTRTIRKVRLQIVRYITFTATHGWSTHYKNNEEILSEAIRTEEIPPGGTQSWQNEGLRIPPTPPTLTACSIIQITYKAVFIIDPSGMSFDFELNMPLIIGSVPLIQNMPQLQQNFRQFSVDHGDGGYEPGTAAPSAPPAQPGMENYPNMPPPSYAEVTTGAVNIKDDKDSEHTRGHLEYTPRYAYFDWSGQPSGLQTQTLQYENRNQ